MEHSVARCPPGYVTEKLVSALLAGAVPVYAGAREVAEVFERGSFVPLAGVGRRGARFDERARAVAARVVDLLRPGAERSASYARLRAAPAVSDAALRRFFSWHPAVWPTHGDSLRRLIVGELARHCNGVG